jgi:drug/metabolite transporter (DMT)-like permease
MLPRLSGLVWCAIFVVLDAVQAVAFGSFLQTMDSFLVGLIVFGSAWAACLLFIAVFAPHQLAAARGDLGAVVWTCVYTAAGWLTYLGAIQLIEPAVALTIASGAVALTMVAASLAGMREASPVKNAIEAAGYGLIALGIVLLAVFTLLGWSGFVRGTHEIGMLGVGLAFLSGAMFALMLLTTYRLDRLGVGAAAVFGLRFPLYLLLAATGFLLGLDDKGPVPATDLFYAYLIGLVVLAMPVYAVQKAVSLSSSLTLGTAAAMTPVLVFFMQMVEGRVDYSGATALGLAVYIAGALTAAAGRARIPASERQREAA